MIVPSIGRKVWYRPSHNDKQLGMQAYDDKPFDADVCYVWSDTEVNLVVTDHHGAQYRRTRVPINVPDVLPRADWMPFQLGQAKKTEADTLEEVRRLASAGKPLI